MGIKITCDKCGVDIEFPNCPHASIDKNEHLAFSIYTQLANEEIKKCWYCQHHRVPRKKEEVDEGGI